MDLMKKGGRYWLPVLLLIYVSVLGFAWSVYQTGLFNEGQ